MRIPRFLPGAALLFWGWQTGFFIPAIVMGLVLESANWVEVRWELNDEDFSRIWIFCTLLFLGAAIYAFTANEGPADFRGLIQNPNYFTQRNAGTASARTAASLIRWLPMLFFFFIAGQAFSSRDGIPLETVSLILRRRWRRARKAGLPMPPMRTINISWLYFGLCLFAASAHNREDHLFFWGLCVLLAWALWPRRCRRFNIVLWAASLGLAIVMGYVGQRGIGHLQRYFEGLNAQWLAGFTRRSPDANRSRTSLGQIGRIKTSGKIVIRIEPKGQAGPPPLLRESSYRMYKGQTWYSGRIENDFEPVNEVLTNKGTWVLLPDKTNLSSVSIACYLDGGKRFGASHAGVLPLAGGSARLEHLRAYLLHKNKAGTLLAEGPGLVMFDDYYGPGVSIDSPPDDEEDKFVLPREKPALDQVIEELQLSGLSPEQQLRSISRFFQTQFTYSIWQRRDRNWNTNETALSRFLLTTRSGHCEYFATATALLLRELHIPARYAVGYAVHEAAGTKYVVRQRDAHAWCLVWNKEQQLWQDFDTTPAIWMRAEEKRASPLQFISDLWWGFAFEISKLRWGQSRMRQYLLWSLAPVLGILLFQIISRSRRQRRNKGKRRTTLSICVGADSEFYQLEQRLAAHGVRREIGETLTPWLARTLREPAFRTMHRPLQDLVDLHYRYRFDPQGLSRPEREKLRRQAQECLERVARLSS